MTVRSLEGRHSFRFHVGDCTETPIYSEDVSKTSF